MTTKTLNKTFFTQMINRPLVRVGLKREDYGRGRWTQTQLHTGGKDKEEQKASFNKAKAEMQKTKADKRGWKNKVATKNETK